MFSRILFWKKLFIYRTGHPDHSISLPTRRPTFINTHIILFPLFIFASSMCIESKCRKELKMNIKLIKWRFSCESFPNDWEKWIIREINEVKGNWTLKSLNFLLWWLEKFMTIFYRRLLKSFCLWVNYSEESS